MAPSHFLVIPKNRVGLTGIRRATKGHIMLLGHLMYVASYVASRDPLLAEDGYRIVVNDGKHGCKYSYFSETALGQSVYHLHLHVIGGKQLTWPPGV